MLQVFWGTLPMVTKHGCMATSPKQKPSHRFGNLCPHSQSALAKFEARQKCLSQSSPRSKHVFPNSHQCINPLYSPKLPPVHQPQYSPKLLPVHQPLYSPKLPPVHQTLYSLKLPPVQQTPYSPKVPPVQQPPYSPKLLPVQQTPYSSKFPPVQQHPYSPDLAPSDYFISQDKTQSEREI